MKFFASSILITMPRIMTNSESRIYLFKLISRWEDANPSDSFYAGRDSPFFTFVAMGDTLVQSARNWRVLSIALNDDGVIVRKDKVF